MEKLLSVVEAAGKLGLHPQTVREYIWTGKLAAVKFGKAWRIHPDELERFSREGVPPAPVQPSIPADALDKIAAHRPHLLPIICNLRSCRAAGYIRRLEKTIADIYLNGETRLTPAETDALAACCVGRRYGESVGGEPKDGALKDGGAE